MATSQAPQAPATLNATTAAAITPYIKTANPNLRGVVRVAADGAFRLNLIASADSTVPTNYVAKQVASGSVTVDGATAGYTSVAEIADFPWPADGRVEIYNPGAGAIHWVSDYRLYE